MVDIVGGADAVAQAIQVVDGGQDIGDGEGAADQLVVVAAEQLLLLFGIAGGVQDLAQLFKGAALVDAALLHVKGEERLGVHAAVGDDLDRLAFDGDGDQVDTGGVGLLGLGAGDLLPCLDQQFAGQGVHHVLSGHLAGDAAGQGQLLVHLVPAEPGQIVPAGVKEEHIDLAGGRLHRGRLAGAQLAVDFQQALLGVFGGILFKGGQDALILAEVVQDVVVGGQAQGAAEDGDGQLAVLVDADIEHAGGVGLILQPGAAVGVHGGAEQLVAHLVVGHAVEHARGADQLADDDALGAVDDEGARVGHQGEIPHEDLLVLDLARLLVQQPGGDPQGGGIGDVAALALLDAVLGLFVEAVIHEAQRQVAGVILNGANVMEHLPQALVQEPLVRVLLHLDEVGHPDDFVDVGEAHPLGLAEFYGLDFHHKIDHSLLLYSTDVRQDGAKPPDFWQTHRNSPCAGRTGSSFFTNFSFHASCETPFFAQYSIL